MAITLGERHQRSRARVAWIGWLVAIVTASYAAPVSFAQTFEVAAIHPRQSPTGRSVFQVLPSGIVELTNVPLRQLIARAYGLDQGLERYTLVEAASFKKVLSARFDIHARLPEGAKRSDLPAPLRQLLADRFKLRVHSETRQLPIYALMRVHPNRLGPGLKASKNDCDAFRAARQVDKLVEEPRDPSGARLCTASYDFNVDGRRGGLRMRDAGPIATVVQRLQAFVDRPLVDATGLSGSFDWIVSFSDDPSDQELPSAVQAVEEQLGLKLETRLGPVDVVVIDHVELATSD